MKINYRAFIEKHFRIRDKEGQIVPFILNDVQRYYLELLEQEYPALQGVRENVLKFRQPGMSSLIDAIFTVDFLLSALRKIPSIISGQIISHKDSETRILFRRVDLFITSFLEKNGITRSDLLKTDTDTYLEAQAGAELFIGTAGARVLGRGGTLQNLHWSEVAFYPNTEILNAAELVPPAEQQVKDGIGKIFRESTGNRKYDFFEGEYQAGKPGPDGKRKSEFRSRFFGWWIHKEYAREAPPDFVPNVDEQKLMREHGVTIEQIYWRRRKVDGSKDAAKAAREYPNDEEEAFLSPGSVFFDHRVLHAYKTHTVKEPMTNGNIAQ